MRFSALAALLLAGTLACITAPASAGQFGALYSFGDSLSDSGNVTIATGGAVPLSPPYALGRFTNGPNWVDDLAAGLGVTDVPALAGGTNFAVGGAQTGTTAVNTARVGDLPSQIAAFKALNPAPVSNVLYTLWIGSNDLIGALTSSNPIGLTPTVIKQAVTNETKAMLALAAAGADRILLVDVPDLGKIPALTELGSPILDAIASIASFAYDKLLFTAAGLVEQSTGIRIDFLDTFGLINDVVADPAMFGFTDATTPCWTGTIATVGVLCSTNLATQNLHLFWDGEHPTTRGHALIAQAAFALLPEPASALLLAASVASLALLRRRNA